MNRKLSELRKSAKHVAAGRARWAQETPEGSVTSKCAQEAARTVQLAGWRGRGEELRNTRAERQVGVR